MTRIGLPLLLIFLFTWKAARFSILFALSTLGMVLISTFIAGHYLDPAAGWVVFYWTACCSILACWLKPEIREARK